MSAPVSAAPTASPSALHIRPATAADEAFIRAVMPRLVEFGPPAWRDAAQLTATDLAVLLEAVLQPTPGHSVFVAEQHQQPLGLMQLTINTDFYQQEHAHLADLVVAPAAEGQGVGRALLEYAESWARARGYHWLTLSVFAQNTHARAIYERAGFGQDIIKYVKVLS
ncbi:GNAT family N-acetyltransferase [Hymenobacter chitinivorans]|uniref:Ribosomal protein S18 acetylase RimI-like enzyme n=1 Tax=Hymenobacter chitinivorans DSM 11115 TaxID=1121954 RepID=A0A2M9B937_9BACT|nr:GNAT family N-acetyltransferase [Hymenobacter chitinivorans]PJJ54460.1 ribosomal protein S18 acetylase RimI-like enzyme [Hymenobacter chitinivorans DSM 11115]